MGAGEDAFLPFALLCLAANLEVMMFAMDGLAFARMIHGSASIEGALLGGGSGPASVGAWLMTVATRLMGE